MLAMVVNDNVGILAPRGVAEFLREHARSYRRAGILDQASEGSGPSLPLW